MKIWLSLLSIYKIDFIIHTISGKVILKYTLMSFQSVTIDIRTTSQKRWLCLTVERFLSQNDSTMDLATFQNLSNIRDFRKQ